MTLQEQPEFITRESQLVVLEMENFSFHGASYFQLLVKGV